jgi:hypothetical protein
MLGTGVLQRSRLSQEIAMALTFHLDTVSSDHVGVLRSTRRTHLALVAPDRPVPVTATVYRRRRLVAAVVAVGLVAVMVFGVASWADRPVGEPFGGLQGVSALGGWSEVGDGMWRYVVAEGDSLWSAARSWGAGGSTQERFDLLLNVAGSARIYPGQVLEIMP